MRKTRNDEVVETAAINRLLPAEMLERVFHLLPPLDLKSVVLVCRWWREVGDAPVLWAWFWAVDRCHQPLRCGSRCACQGSQQAGGSGITRFPTNGAAVEGN